MEPLLITAGISLLATIITTIYLYKAKDEGKKSIVTFVVGSLISITLAVIPFWSDIVNFFTEPTTTPTSFDQSSKTATENVNTNTNENSNTTTTTTENVNSNTTNNKNITTTEKTNTTKTITDNTIYGYFSYENEEHVYTYTPKIEGLYRFDFSIENAKYNIDYNYRFTIQDSVKDINQTSYYTSDGLSITLKANVEYTIIINQYQNYPEYRIDIGVPSKIVNITSNEISASLSFKDDTDVYTYKAPKSGTYRFDFNLINPSYDQNYNYRFSIQDATKDLSRYDYYSNSGLTVDLTAGVEYYITVEQNSAYPEYKINIGVPNDISYISSNTFSGKLNYTDQKNIYKFTPAKDGAYEFKFELKNVSADKTYNYQFTIQNDTNELNNYSFYSSRKFQVDLKANETYTITIKQYDEFPEYYISINNIKES